MAVGYYELLRFQVRARELRELFRQRTTHQGRFGSSNFTGYPIIPFTVNSDTSIYVGCLEETAWVRIEGVATKDTSSGIRRYFSDRFSEGLRNYVIDLENCRLIDSTFIGILTGLAGNIAEDDGGNQGEVKVIHSNERNTRSICKLGLDNLIKIEKDGNGSTELENRISEHLDPLEDEDEVDDRAEKEDMIIKAHEDICSANEENYEKFSDVLRFLRKDLDGGATNNN